MAKDPRSFYCPMCNETPCECEPLQKIGGHCPTHPDVAFGDHPDYRYCWRCDEMSEMRDLTKGEAETFAKALAASHEVVPCPDCEKLRKVIRDHQMSKITDHASTISWYDERLWEARK